MPPQESDVLPHESDISSDKLSSKLGMSLPQRMKPNGELHKRKSQTKTKTLPVRRKTAMKQKHFDSSQQGIVLSKTRARPAMVSLLSSDSDEESVDFTLDEARLAEITDLIDRMQKMTNNSPETKCDSLDVPTPSENESSRKKAMDVEEDPSFEEVDREMLLKIGDIIDSVNLQKDRVKERRDSKVNCVENENSVHNGKHEPSRKDEVHIGYDMRDYASTKQSLPEMKCVDLDCNLTFESFTPHKESDILDITKAVLDPQMLKCVEAISKSSNEKKYGDESKNLLDQNNVTIPEHKRALNAENIDCGGIGKRNDECSTDNELNTKLTQNLDLAYKVHDNCGDEREDAKAVPFEAQNSISSDGSLKLRDEGASTSQKDNPRPVWPEALGLEDKILIEAEVKNSKEDFEAQRNESNNISELDVVISPEGPEGPEDSTLHESENGEKRSDDVINLAAVGASEEEKVEVLEQWQVADGDDDTGSTSRSSCTAESKILEDVRDVSESIQGSESVIDEIREVSSEECSDEDERRDDSQRDSETAHTYRERVSTTGFESSSSREAHAEMVEPTKGFGEYRDDDRKIEQREPYEDVRGSEMETRLDVERGENDFSQRIDTVCRSPTSETEVTGNLGMGEGEGEGEGNRENEADGHRELGLNLKKEKTSIEGHKEEEDQISCLSSVQQQRGYTEEGKKGTTVRKPSDGIDCSIQNELKVPALASEHKSNAGTKMEETSLREVYWNVTPTENVSTAKDRSLQLSEATDRREDKASTCAREKIQLPAVVGMSSFMMEDCEQEGPVGSTTKELEKLNLFVYTASRLEEEESSLFFLACGVGLL